MLAGTANPSVPKGQSGLETERSVSTCSNVHRERAGINTESDVPNSSILECLIITSRHWPEPLFM